MPYLIDHLVVSACDLEEGRAAMEGLLDVEFGPRGAHVDMATENRLVALHRSNGEMPYLEVIAPDPEAKRPDFPRWFDLDNFSGAPRLTNWVISCPDLEQALACAPAGTGRIMSFTRGAFSWRMIVPETGVLPFDNCFPALIQWHSEHPAPGLVDPGLIFRRLKITHPDAEGLQAALAPFAEALENVRIVQGLAPGMTAEIGTASGEIWIA